MRHRYPACLVRSSFLVLHGIQFTAISGNSNTRLRACIDMQRRTTFRSRCARRDVLDHGLFLDCEFNDPVMRNLSISRRQFIKGSTAALALSTLDATALPFFNQSKTYRVGVIGTGW